MKVVFKTICQADEKYKELIENQSIKENRIILKKFHFFEELIKNDYLYGESIKKINLEKNQMLLNAFFQRYGHLDLLNLDNCFCCDLTRSKWRMLYTLDRDNLDDTQYILCFMIIDHKTYEKYFT